MEPFRKSGSLNKRFSNGTYPEKDIGSSSKSKQRRKLSKKLGPRWSKEELERFYDAYRSYGQNWKKVAAVVRNNRSIEMVEVLFNMNRAYLSLPEGTASVAGLIAMMTDHYNVMDRSDGDGEGLDDSEAPRKYQKRKRAKDLTSHSKGVRSSQIMASADGCLAFLKQTQGYEMRRRATGERTPRFPIPSLNMNDGGESFNPLNKRARNSLDSNDDFSRFVALALTDASKQDSVNDSGKNRQRDGKASEINAASLIGKKRVDREKVLRKGKRYFGKQVKVDGIEGFYSDDSGEACSGTDGRNCSSPNMKVDVETSTSTGKYSPHKQKKRRKKHVCGDKFDALQALAELSTSMLPSNLIESESSAQLKEERPGPEIGDKFSTPEATIRGVGVSNNEKSKFEKRKSVDIKSIAEGAPTRKPKPKMIVAEALRDSHQKKPMNSKELAEGNKSVLKTKRGGRIFPSQKQLKPVRKSEKSYSNGDEVVQQHDIAVSTPSISALSIPKKPPNRRKINLKKAMQERTKYLENNNISPLHDKDSLSEQELLKEKLFTFLSSPLARRWCNFEWFYSTIDYPWFTKLDFVDYLNHVGLRHAPGLTRLEWSVFKSSLGRPRRFSEKYLQDERQKLNQYRECARKHYSELRNGAREELPTDLACPVSVGDRVIAIHPKTFEIHDGKILTIDHNKCSILFDRSELGVGPVADIDCMPWLPFEYMPEALGRQNLSVDKGSLLPKEAEVYGHSVSGGSVSFPSSRLEIAPMNPLVKQDDTNQTSGQGKTSVANKISAQQTAYQQSTGRAVNHLQDKKELEPRMLGIFKSSRLKAREMVDVAVAAASSVKEEKDAYEKIREALDLIGKHQSISESKLSGINHQERVNGTLYRYSQSLSNTSEPSDNGLKSNDSLEENELQIPSELISSCVATWLMIQRCTERQYPPADVAQLIDSALTSLHPHCPQNVPIFREIQTCMGRIKTQILALVPT